MTSKNRKSLSYSRTDVFYTVCFFSVFIVLLTGRIAIAGKGYLEDTDEFSVLFMMKEFDSLCELDTRVWSNTIFHLWSHLPDNIIRFLQLIPVMSYAESRGITPQNPEALIIFGYFNIATSIILLLVFYALLKKLQFNRWQALVGVTLFGTLLSTNVYTRHILQYDHSLLWHLTALTILIGRSINAKKILLVGAISAFGVTSYPPHYMFVAITAGWLYWGFYDNQANAFKRMFLFLVPFVVVVTVIELFCRIDNRSYISFLLEYGGEGRNIDTYEGFTMIFHYFYRVEGIWGLTLLIFGIIGIFLSKRLNEMKHAQLLLLLAFTAYISFSFLTWISNNMVLYGRGVYMYIPFVIIGVTYLLKFLKIPYIPLIFAAAFLNYHSVIITLNAIEYPKQIIYKFGLKNNETHAFNFKYELESGIEYEKYEKWNVLGVPSSILPEGNYEVVNVAFMLHQPDTFINTYRKYPINPEDSIVFSTPYFMTFPIYAFQYCAREGRNFYMNTEINTMIIKKKHP